MHSIQSNNQDVYQWPRWLCKNLSRTQSLATGCRFSHNVWKENETVSSGELQKQEKSAFKEVIEIYNNECCDAISKFELIEKYQINLIAYWFLNMTLMFQWNYSMNNKNNRGMGSQLLQQDHYRSWSFPLFRECSILQNCIIRYCFGFYKSPP